MKKDKIYRYVFWAGIICIFFLKFIVSDIDNIIRPIIYMYLYVLLLLLLKFFLLNLEKIKKRETKSGFIFYIIGSIIMFPLALISLYSSVIQSTSYLLTNNHRIIQGELIDKNTSTFTFAQWMTYDVKLENGEIKHFDYLFPTKRAMIGDTVTFKAGYKGGWSNDGIIITIDEIKKKNLDIVK